MKKWLSAVWQGFLDSYDPDEVTDASHPLAVLIAPGGFAFVFIVTGYVPAVSRLSGFEAPGVSLMLVALGAICSLAAWRWHGRGPLGAPATLFDTGFYSASVCWAALHSEGGFAIGFAVVLALSAVMFIAQIYSLSLLQVLVAWLPALGFLLFAKPHPAAAVILGCGCFMYIYAAYTTKKRRELVRGARQLEDALGATDKVLDAAMQHALTTSLLNLGNFLHELRNVQTAVRMNLEFLREQPGLNGDVESAVDDALQASRGEQALIDETIEDLRRQARPGGGTIMLESILREAIESAGTKPEISVRGSCPGFEIAGEPGHLSSVFRNLLRNARQAGASRVEVELHSEPNGLAAQVIIRDNGPGIPKERLPRLFQPFLSSNKVAGTGLGLYLTRRYVELMHGSITAENSQSGAVFRIRLPGRFGQPALASPMEAERAQHA